MSDELSFEASELFRAARFGLSPSTDDLVRGRRRIAAALAGVTTLGAASSVAVAKTTSAATTAVVAGAIAASVVAGGIAWWRVSHHTTPAMPSLVLPAPEPETIPPPSEVPSAVVHELVPPEVHASPPARTEAHEVAPAPPATPTDELARELELVRTADAALRDGDATRALEIARSPHVEQLAAELAAIEIDALCSLGHRDEARDRATAFHAHFPWSALWDRVKRSCAGGAR